MRLPPGQHEIDGFPRFGTHLGRPAPAVPADPAIEIGGAVTEPTALPVAALATLPRRELTADFHCVAGWSATGLRWEGVAFETFYRKIIEPSLRAGRHDHACRLRRPRRLPVDRGDRGRAGGRRADRRPARRPAARRRPRRAGATGQPRPVRLRQHQAPLPHRAAHRRADGVRAAHPISQIVLRGPLIQTHPRARVWEEERHPHLPARLLRPFYRLSIPLIAFLGQAPRMRLPNAAHTSRPWRIHALTPDFRLEDVWALPTPGGPDDFPRLVRQFTAGDPSTQPVPRRPRAVRDPVEGRGAARLGRPGRRPRRARADAPRPLAGGSARRPPGPDFDAASRSARSTCSTTSGRRRSSTAPSTGSCTSAGSRTGRAATAARWPSS